MIQFKDVIKEQIQILPDSKKWWPRYLYHFTDIKNALGIIDEEWIFCRRSAIVLDRMKSDNASASVLSTSQNAITEYARLYFRPKTPTQYHNEGYKPQGIRSADLNASCPIPDPKKVWRYPKKVWIPDILPVHLPNQKDPDFGVFF